MDLEARTDATAALGSTYCPLHRDAFAAAHQAGKDTSGMAVKLALGLEEIEVKGDNTFSFISTTGVVDRDQDVIKPKGLDVSAWNKNSIILFSHDVRVRIGVGDTRLTSRGDKWITTADYFPEGISTVAPALRRMIDFRIARAKRLKTEDKGAAFSLGFIPEKLVFVPARGGFDIEKAEKLEDSDVSLQSNRDALIAREAFSDGVGLGGLFDWAEHVRKEAGIDGVNHEVGQRLIELIDPTKGLTLVEITPDHLKRLRLDSPAAAKCTCRHPLRDDDFALHEKSCDLMPDEPPFGAPTKDTRPIPGSEVPIAGTLEETAEPIDFAIKCHEKGLGEELTRDLLRRRFPELPGEPAKPEAPELPAGTDPTDQELTASIERAMAGDGIKNLLIQEKASTGHLN